MADEPQTIEEQTARMIVEDADPLARKVYEISGQPFGIPTLSPEHQLWAWQHLDTTVDPHALRAAGMSDAEIGDHMYPLRRRLREQAGLTWKEQQAYSDRMAERVLRAAEAGKVPEQPPRGPGSL